MGGGGGGGGGGSSHASAYQYGLIIARSRVLLLLPLLDIHLFVSRLLVSFLVLNFACAIRDENSFLFFPSFDDILPKYFN